MTYNWVVTDRKGDLLLRLIQKQVQIILDKAGTQRALSNKIMNQIMRRYMEDPLYYNRYDPRQQ